MSALSVNPAMALVSSPSDSEEKTLVFNQTVANEYDSVSKEAGLIIINVINDDYSKLRTYAENSHGIFFNFQKKGDFIKLTSTQGDISVHVEEVPNIFMSHLPSTPFGAPIWASNKNILLNSAQNIKLAAITKNVGYRNAQMMNVIRANSDASVILKAQGINSLLMETKSPDDTNYFVNLALGMQASGNGHIMLQGKSNTLTMDVPNATQRYLLRADTALANIQWNATEGNNELFINGEYSANRANFLMGIMAYGTSTVNDTHSITLSALTGDNIIQLGDKNLTPNPRGKFSVVMGINTVDGYTSGIDAPFTGSVNLLAKQNTLSIYAPNTPQKIGMQASGKTAYGAENIRLEASEKNNVLLMDTHITQFVSSDKPFLYGIASSKTSKILFSALNGANIIEIGEREDETSRIDGTAIGLWANSAGVSLQAKHNQVVLHSPVSMQPIAISARGFYTGAPNILLNASDTNTVYSLSQGIYASTQAKVVLNATNTNQIGAGSTAITSWDKAAVQLSAGKMNNISAGNTALLTATEGQIAIDGPVNIQAPSVADARSSSKISIYYEKNSQMQGNLRATDKGMIDVRSKGSTMALTGDSIAMNQGAINLQLTSGSILTGRVDNSSAYQHTDYRRLFAPVSDTDTLPEAIGAGEVNLSLANNAVWNMTGQSWVSQLGGAGGIINLRAMTNGGAATQGRALHIDSLEGKQKFVLSLNKDDYTQSDMLYIKQGTADEQTLVIQNLDELAASMQPDDRVRFATVSHSLDEFREGKIYRSDAGLFEQSLKVHYVSRAKESEQDLAQDRLINGTQFTLEKSGDEYIRQQYDGDESKNVYLVKMTPSPVNPPVEEQPVVEEPITTPGNPTDQPRVEEPTETPEDLVESTPILPPIVNRPAMIAIQYIPALSLRYLTDLDTYTKREGTQAYANPAQKAGFWARVSRLGLKDDFSLKGNTYEIGYDRFMRNDMKRKHKWGVSYTYGSVHGDFTTWRANAHLKKHMLSLHSTNHYGNYDQDAYYNDNAVRIGKLIHDYRIDRENGKLWGEGGYHQYFASVSTEHGYRAWLNKTKTWYVTPQIQLQYSYLRGKSYQSSNQVNIKLGHVNSLIGRLGVDAVKVLDKETQTRIYARASILHEFLGKQHIQAHDRTGNYHRTFKMKGTWGVIGGGFSIIPDKNTYVFLDGEKTFGAHRDGYNFRVGLSWRFN
ncbi:autotransporter outer membrane beta-barrel domain-containing protein [Pelistega europaea]|uniref:Autotransporter outer membrane beta-barrel domain-containing protein n=1 Tax=Pelistega europaea TaxID=106147 RepID=A0A7Y4P5L0_9BURK|nr:autotransporter outer membrane beta-barrel domain-containing protein [Pelistega europaea]NOL48959.1 autotransporter outer membrane beta-barrel domain-containing protein [Pelistega europaea]